jgi:transketolase
MATALTIGGSADLTALQPDADLGTRLHRAGQRFKGRYIHYGIREHAMAAAMNGCRCMAASFPMAAPSWCSPIMRAAACGCRR